MSSHSYSLRSRISSSSLSSRNTTQSPSGKPVKSPRKGTTLIPAADTNSILQLKHVIGTTTTNPGGLSCCTIINSYAYCAGSVVVFATLDAENRPSYRYFKARPLAVPINQIASFYNSSSAPSTPNRRRTTFGNRKPYEDHNRGTFSRDWSDESGAHTWSARERIKAASCVSISPDGNILAVGESGYNPRVLLFSTATSSSSDTPLSVMTDHTVGVRSVAFSPDSRYLATLGDVNDGFLYIWRVNTKTGSVKLHSSNKCTTNVCDMTWCGNSVITVGTRHVKIWDVSQSESMFSGRRTRLKHEENTPSSMPKPLQGRNCLLGPFVEATFTAVVALCEDQAVVCADDGHFCLLDLRHGKPELSAIAKYDTPVAALTIRQHPIRIVWAGGGGLEERNLSDTHLSDQQMRSHCSTIDAKKRRTTPRHSSLRQSLGLCPPQRAVTVAIGSLGDRAVSIDAEGAVRVFVIDAHDSEPDISRISSHKCAVRGVQKLAQASELGSFCTWSEDGDVRFWDSDGSLNQAVTIKFNENIDMDDVTPNELRLVRCTSSGKIVITGDQHGVVNVIKTASWIPSQTVRAHSAEINDIAIHETTSLLATCSRDRMIQVFTFQADAIELLQTLDDHISSVNQVLFSQNGNRLLSCSADRSVVIRDRIERKLEPESTSVSAFIPTKTITFKTTPLSMNFSSVAANTLVVSTTDRHILQVDLASGVIMTSFKATDRDSDDTVALNAISLRRSKGFDKRHLLAGYSAIDKSIRVYDLEKGILLGRDSGHIEGVSDLAILDEDIPDVSPTNTTIVSTGLDGTVMVWSIAPGGQSSLVPQQDLTQVQNCNSGTENTAPKSSSALLPPLRKILSKMDVVEFARQSSPTREVSPNSLGRKTSRLNLATSIEETDEIVCSDMSAQQSRDDDVATDQRSPSPIAKPLIKLKVQRSRPDMRKGINTKYVASTQSPSPPRDSAAVLVAPKQDTRANNGRLRRPPSVPSDLRTKTAAQGRRQSVAITEDLGSVAMASDQTCRLLRAYHKRLIASQGDLDLSDIEIELEALLRTVKEKKARTRGTNDNSQMKQTRSKVDDIDITRLSDLLEKTGVS